MKPLVLSFVLCLTVGTAEASTVFSLTQNLNVTLSGAVTHIEQAWDFTSLAGWSQSLTIQSVKVTETFSGVSTDANFRSTVIGPYSPTPGVAQNKIYFLFADQKPTVIEIVTLSSPYPCCSDGTATFSPGADLTGGGVLGKFDTRVARNAGTFTAGSITVAITATPEPASLALVGFGLIALALAARRLF